MLYEWMKPATIMMMIRKTERERASLLGGVGDY